MEQNVFLTKMIGVVVAFVVLAVVLVPLCDSLAGDNGGGGGGSGGGDTGTVVVPDGLVNSTYVSGATFMSDELGFEAITDTDVTSTFPTLKNPLFGNDTNVAFGRCEVYLVDDTSYDTLYSGTNYQAILSYSIYTGEWTIDAKSNGTWDVGSWTLDTTGHITLTYPNGKGSNMPDTYKVLWMWYDSETSNYHDMGGMIVGLKANSTNAGDTYSLVNKGQYVGIFGTYYDTTYRQEVPIVYMGQIGDDWTIDIEYDVYDSVSAQVYHQEKTVSLEYTGDDLSIPIITNVIDEETGLAVVESDVYRGIFTVSQTVDGPGGFRPVTISYQEIYDAVVNEEWNSDYLNLFELEDGLIDGKIYSYIIAKVGDPRYIMDWEDDDGPTVTPAGTFARDDFLFTFDNGYGMLKGNYVWVFDSDIQFYGDTKITWYDPDVFVRGTFDATFFPSVGQPRNQQSNVENYVSTGTFTPDSNGDYLMFDTNDGVYPTMIAPSSWLNIANPEYGSSNFAYLYMAKNGNMFYYHNTAERYDTVKSYFHLICPFNASNTGNVENLSQSNATYVIPMTLGYYTYDPEYDAENNPIQIGNDRSASASAETDTGNDGTTGTLIRTIPIFVALGLIVGIVGMFYQNRKAI